MIYNGMRGGGVVCFMRKGHELKVMMKNKHEGKKDINIPDEE